MSAPDTNIDKQTDDHKSPLLGMGAAVAFAGVLLLGLMVWLSANGNNPGEEQEPTAAAVVSTAN
jgi:hypothetical protein